MPIPRGNCKLPARQTLAGWLYHKLAHVYLNQILLACIHFMTKQSEQALDAGPSRSGCPSAVPL